MADARQNGADAARQLLEYLERQRAQRCEDLLERADAEADELRREARRRALALVREAVRRERSRREARLREERARIDARFRRERFRRERRELKRARTRLAEALVERWDSGVEARHEWIRMTCEQALTFLPDGEWRVVHPRGWDASEGAPFMELLKRVRPEVEIEFEEDEQDAGLLVGGGPAAVDTRPAGLMADRRRVDGLLLRAVERIELEANTEDSGEDGS